MSNELEAFIEYITVIRALSKRSVEAYQSDLNSLEENIQKSLINIDSKELLNVLSQYKNKRTLNRKLSSVNAFFDFCYKNQYSEEKTKLKFAKTTKLLPKFLSYNEIQNSLLLIERTAWLGLREYDLILILYETV